MKKAYSDGLILIALFFAGFWLLSQINWMTVFKVQQKTNKVEEKLGELFWDSFKVSEKENTNTYVAKAIDSIVNTICIENKIDKNTIKVHILNQDEINAFALPDGHLVINSGLILASANPEELSGVICHEIAHIQLNHVMKKLIKEVGLSVLISLTTDNRGTEIIKETATVLSSSAFDRSLEKEADIKAVDYLINAKINPESFANFMYILSEDEDDTTDYLWWASTHPNLKERAEYIIENSSEKSIKYKSVLSNITWIKVKEELKKLEGK